MPKILADRGDVATARAGAGRLFETSYQKGYVAHASLEPHAAVAEIKQGKATVWASTQTPFPTRDRIAAALRMDPARVRVIAPFLGGGFGGKSGAVGTDYRQTGASRVESCGGVLQRYL